MSFSAEQHEIINNAFSYFGLTNSATKEEVHKAYLKLVKRYHPDKFQDLAAKELAEEKIKEANNVNDALNFYFELCEKETKSKQAASANSTNSTNNNRNSKQDSSGPSTNEETKKSSQSSSTNQKNNSNYYYSYYQDEKSKANAEKQSASAAAASVENDTNGGFSIGGCILGIFCILIALEVIGFIFAHIHIILGIGAILFFGYILGRG